MNNFVTSAFGRRICALILTAITLFALSAPLTVSATTDREEADRVQAMIDTISDMGLITLDDEAAIREIRAAYDALTGVQKRLVDTTALFNAETQITMLRGVKIDQLSELISQIGDPVTLADEPIIVEAMEIYEWLYLDERSQVDYEKLVSASNTLKKLQKAAAAEVDELIAAIDNYITHDSNVSIQNARAAYDALTPGSKSYVKNLAFLEQAEQTYASLVPNITLVPSTGNASGISWILIFVAVSLLIIAPAIVIPIVVTNKRRHQPPYYQ